MSNVYVWKSLSSQVLWVRWRTGFYLIGWRGHTAQGPNSCKKKKNNKLYRDPGSECTRKKEQQVSRWGTFVVFINHPRGQSGCSRVSGDCSRAWGQRGCRSQPCPQASRPRAQSLDFYKRSYERIENRRVTSSYLSFRRIDPAEVWCVGADISGARAVSERQLGPQQ